MIDIENYVVNAVATALSDILVISEYVEAPPEFPCVSIIEESNVSAETFDNASPNENHADLLYTVNVYSNLQSGAKAEVKDIMEEVDTVLEGLKFQRTMCQAIPNADRTIYRMTARYTARVGKGVTDGETTTYQIYR